MLCKFAAGIADGFAYKSTPSLLQIAIWYVAFGAPPLGVKVAIPDAQVIFCELVAINRTSGVSLTTICCESKQPSSVRVTTI